LNLWKCDVIQAKGALIGSGQNQELIESRGSRGDPFEMGTISNLFCF
jgi:hypothetical protein